MIQLLPLELAFGLGANLYAVKRAVIGGVLQYWNPTINSGAGGYENFAQGHWGAYALAAATNGDGYYWVANPPASAGILSSETWYSNAAPTFGDVPVAPVQHALGQNVVGVAGDPVAAANVGLAAASSPAGTALAGATNQIIPTSLTNAQAAAAVGGSLVFSLYATGAPNCIGRIVGASAGTLTLAAPLSAVPAAGDAFVVE